MFVPRRIVGHRSAAYPTHESGPQSATIGTNVSPQNSHATTRGRALISHISSPHNILPNQAKQYTAASCYTLFAIAPIGPRMTTAANSASILTHTANTPLRLDSAIQHNYNLSTCLLSRSKTNTVAHLIRWQTPRPNLLPHSCAHKIMPETAGLNKHKTSHSNKLQLRIA